MARSLLLAGQAGEARAAAERSIDICGQERWNAFLPWPQALRAHCLAAAGRCGEARDDAEHAFALACQLGDPCWEGMAGRALALLALHTGDGAAAAEWITDAQRRCDRVPDRYVWVSGFVALGHLEIAAREQPDLVAPLARRLYRDALRMDLPEFTAWALIYQAEAGDLANLALARSPRRRHRQPGAPGPRRRAVRPVRVRPVQPEGEQGAQPDRFARLRPQASRDIGVADHREAPVVQGDHLGQDLGAEPAPVAGDGVDPQPGGGGHGAVRAGTGSTPAGLVPRHQPRACWAISVAKTSSALRIMCTAPSG